MGKKFSKKGKQFLVRRILPAGLILAACTTGAYVVTSAQYSSRFLPGTVISGIDVSERSLEEAVSAIRDREEQYKLTIRFRGGTEEVLDAEDMDLSYDCDNEMQKLLSGQNTYSWLSREFGNESAHNLTTGYSYGEKALKNALAELPELQEGNYAAPTDAQLNLERGLTFAVVPETEGSQIKPAVLAKKAGAAIEAGEPVLDLTEDTEVYEEPSVRSNNKDLKSRLASLNRLLSANVAVRLTDGSLYRVDKRTTINWLSVDKNGLRVVDEKAVRKKAAALIAELAKKDDTYGYFRPFASTNYGMQKFDSENLHGHKLDQARMAKALANMVISGRHGVLNPQYTEFVDALDPHLGGTYAEVDIYEQHVYYYENNQLVYDCSCVTGTEGYSSTPSGIFSIDEKIRGRELNGYRADGSLSYSVYVKYWMCFLPHYGFHDASWRDSFGGSIYEYDGSHGCINLPTSAAATLYDLLDYGTPVIVFRGEIEKDEPLEQTTEADWEAQGSDAV